ncbi:hypothetical protein LTR50_003457 [Elasticomyces elasticus]|nr:hypothetical protein LTR50_003457 [Elasticomyces elasticus]
MFTSPFALSTSRPGAGTIHLSLLAPATPSLRTLSYQYPLKLLAPTPLLLPTSTTTTSSTARAHLVHTVFLLSYGGGLVAGDEITLRICVEACTRLVLLTQGSTKVFARRDGDGGGGGSSQQMSVRVERGGAWVCLTDPVQVFAGSWFEQGVVCEVDGLVGGEGEGGVGADGNGGADGVGEEEEAALCVLDWVCEGRRARGESWLCRRYASRNEIWLCSPPAAAGEDEGDDGVAEGLPRRKRRLLLRDNIVLDASTAAAPLADRMDGLGVFGTLILHGALFSPLARFFLREFSLLPRIGGRNWDSGSDDGGGGGGEAVVADEEEVWRQARQRQETVDGLIWTAADVRGCVVVKFGAREVEGAKRWLYLMLKKEGTCEREFGERSLLCLKS